MKLFCTTVSVLVRAFISSSSHTHTHTSTYIHVHTLQHTHAHTHTDGASADGYHFPINLNNVTLDPAVITPSRFALATPTKVNVSCQYSYNRLVVYDSPPPHTHTHSLQFTLSSTAVAPYVYLESLNTPPGTFSDNGFLLMKGSSQNMSFDCFEQIDLHDFVTGLSIRYVFRLGTCFNSSLLHAT